MLKWIAAGAGLLFALSVRAGIDYEFGWSFPPYSGSGLLVLSDSIGVGQDFVLDDIESIEIDLFDGDTVVASQTSPPEPFDPPFDVIKGTREAGSLSMLEFAIGLPSFPGFFGCNDTNCFSGEVRFPGVGDLDFGSPEAARASFVLTELPEPGAGLSLAAMGLGLAALGVSRRRDPSLEGSAHKPLPSDGPLGSIYRGLRRVAAPTPGCSHLAVRVFLLPGLWHCVRTGTSRVPDARFR